MEVHLQVLSSPPSKPPLNSSFLFVGHLEELNAIKYEDVSSRTGNLVSVQDWISGFSSLEAHPTETLSLNLNNVYLAALPNSCSRHNTPSHAHSLTKIIKNLSFGSLENHHIIVVGSKSIAYASGCAVARAYPTYTRKTLGGTEPKKSKTTVSIDFIFPNEKMTLTPQEAESIEHSIFGIQTAARIVDTPCNDMHVNIFLEEVKNIGKKLGIKPLIIQGEELRKKGMGGIYGVGKAAVNPPALAVLSHTPKKATQTISWVGKGIVYDTGGLSIKGKTAMPGMKRDCGGAAGILGAFYAAVKNDFTQNLHAVFCLAENSVGPNATRPDDIHFLYSGRSVEINNTDAEGRLVVSDGVVYAQKDLKSDIIVDVCTLTGAQGVATGNAHAAFLTNKFEWESKTRDAGRSSGDLVFPLVYCPEIHFSEFNSVVADMKNSVADRSNATSSCAGLFINAHLGFNFPGTWIHVDMASPAYTGERATGYGVALLNTLFGDLSQCKLLQNGVKLMKNSESADDKNDNVQVKKMKLSE
eukprot:TRINITY_DN1103_c0_g1_i1.p1 TRINITY_DN1103_c0_g1~~TRINITY_DN1103_c0_g1_i1.p1  ORF type:complete len:527 (-),score=93.30 TRINITY_DN1103_c0_g1_i1:123-1703(-)